MDELQEDVSLREEAKPTVTSSKSCTPFVYVAAAVANLTMLTAGIAFAWTSPVLPKLQGSLGPAHNPLQRPITPTEEALVASLMSLSGIFGPWMGGPLAGRLGRKRALLLVAIPMALAFLIAAFAQTIPWYYIARLLMGASASSIYTVLPMYVSEIAQDHNRGTLGCFLGVSFSSGLLFSYSLGPFLTIRNFCLVCLLPLVVFVPVFGMFMPETPQFLALKDDQDSLKVSLAKLGRKDFVQQSFKKASSFGDLYKSVVVRKALVVCFVLVALEQASGIRAILAYMQTIFALTGSGLSPEFPPIIVGSVKVCTTVVTASLVDKLGRRVLLLGSAIGSCLALLGLSIYFRLEIDGISWLPIASLIVFVVAFNMGLGPLPWAIAGELFAPDIKSLAITLTSSLCFLISFVVILIFPLLVRVFGADQSFGIFAIICGGGAVFIYMKVPETKGKSLQEIRRMLEP